MIFYVLMLVFNPLPPAAPNPDAVIAGKYATADACWLKRGTPTVPGEVVAAARARYPNRSVVGYCVRVTA